MKTIKSKLSKINSYWNKYYFIKEFFQKKIRFTDEVKTNYYGDLNNYLHDTLDLVKPFKKIKSYKDYISQIIVLLQVIYTQQDLIDELLHIFKLQYSTKEDKNPNRDIRNELIGHPISRDKSDNNKLKSSILFDIVNKDENYISYVKYSMKESELKKYSVQEIIENHKIFLNKYLDKILNKIEKEIKDSLKYYYQNMRKHRRYLYCLKQYKKTLKSVIKNEEDKTKYYSLIDCYYIEQLQKKDTYFTIDKIIKIYQDNPIILNELKNIESNFYNDAEYYASLNFLSENEKELLI